MNVSHCSQGINHNGNGAIDFVTDLVMHAGNHPCPKYNVGFDEIAATGDHACFVVVKSRIVERQYSKDAIGTVPVYKFVLMDGSGSLFKAVTNSCLSNNLCNFSLKVGSSLIVYDYELVWMQSFREIEFRFVMLINKCTWKNRPSDCADLGRPVKSVHVNLCLIAVDKVDNDSIVVFTVPVNDHPERYVWNHLVSKACTLGQMQDGDWIAEPSTRFQWTTFITPLLTLEGSSEEVKDMWRDESFLGGINSWNMNGSAYRSRGSVECKCVAEFGLCQCVCETFPVDEMNVYDIFTSCVCRLDALKANDIVDWESLSASHKRWCIYWWYAVNIYGIRSCARPLPTCIVKSVRKAYPNPIGVPFTGFKSSVERLSDKENGRNKRAKEGE